MRDAQQIIDALVHEASAAPIKGLPRPWLDPANLPAPGWRSGFLVPEMVLSWLLDAQARAEDAQICEPLARCLPLLEPEGADPLVRALLEGFQKAGADVRDKFVLTPAAALASPGLILTQLCPLILRWARRRRGKLAAFALDALGAAAVARPDPRGAIYALGALRAAFRDNQRRALVEQIQGHLEAAARRARIAIGPLIDYATPTINIGEAGRWRLSTQPPLVEAAPVSPRGLAWWVEDQPVAGAPTTLGSAGRRARVKALSESVEATFDVIVKRLQDAALAGRLWTAGGFVAHLIQHPLVACPARRLIWTALDGSGQPVGTFRPRDDGAFVDAHDELFTTPHTWVRPAHPARMSPADIGVWQAHLEYHGLTPPFDQLGRPTEICPPGQRHRRVYTGLSGVNWREIHDRPEAFAGGPWSAILRLGWHVGWVRTVPGPSGPIDVIARTSEATGDLEWVYFMPYRPGAITHNDFPAPRRPDDRALMTLGEVPAAIYAEVIHDLRRMFAA